MRTDNGRSVSRWMATSGEMTRGPLTADTNADVCIVGAGIAGLSAAYFLSKEGKSVVVLDDGPIGGGETCRTTAHLVTALDDRYIDLAKDHGVENARLVADSHASAIDAVEAIVKQEEIECDFRRVDGYLMLSHGEQMSLLEKELMACRNAGLEDVLIEQCAPFDEWESGPCLRFPRQAQFHPLKYLEGLASGIESRGGCIYTGSHVSSVEGGHRTRISTADGKAVTAATTIVATNSPINDRFAIHGKQAPYRSYVIGVGIPHGSFPQILLWDTGPYSTTNGPVPYHYVRVDGDVLIVGGEDHKTGQADDAERRFTRLEDWTRHRFPFAKDVLYRWSGQVLEPADGLAFIGRNPGDENVYIASGDSGNGMTHGTIAGVLLTDLIVGRKNRWEALYDPARKTLRSLPTIAKDNWGVACKYGELLTGGDVRSAEDVQPGTGAVIRRGIKKIALYRDDEGKAHAFSAVCRHAGCIVHWNTFEQTWDCPCHGGRYSKEGKVINGPPNAGLTRL